MPVNVLLAQEWVPEHRSVVSSLMMGFAWGVGGVAAPLVGKLADLLGLAPALFAVGLLPSAGVWLAWRLPPEPAPPPGRAASAGTRPGSSPANGGPETQECG